MTMEEVVWTTEFGIHMIGQSTPKQNAKTNLASRMYTDAVFNGCVRTIGTIINRIDAGLPKDTEIDEYQTLFGDCMNEVLSMTSGDQLTVKPSDSVMLALCKALYDIAVQDIYTDYREDENGNITAKRKNASPEAKQARDAARRMVLERAGGRKTLASIPKELASVEIADWITGLPQPEDEVKEKED